MGRTALHWFRQGGALRLHDNRALRRAVCSSDRVIPLYVLEDEEINSGDKRLLFLLETLQDLDLALQNLGSRLIVARGRASETVPRLAQRWKAELVSFSAPTSDPDSARTCSAVQSAAKRCGIKTVHEVDHLLGIHISELDLDASMEEFTESKELGNVEKLDQLAGKVEGARLLHRQDLNRSEFEAIPEVEILPRVPSLAEGYQSWATMNAESSSGANPLLQVVWRCGSLPCRHTTCIRTRM
mmetsp:Transcript_9145/g.27517  ORF Transcript_9145/g.27517 Transcript_9145/m.27517 type:complete len:242 (+) Transcript_9145:330-1055(+)